MILISTKCVYELKIYIHFKLICIQQKTDNDIELMKI